MLKRLAVRNYALIDAIDIDFSDKLTIITGETGAGKSILLGALELIMGGRADMKAFYNEAEKCVIEAWFEVKKYGLNSFFEENELDYDNEVVIRRELTPSGKSRAFINDTPVNNQILKQITDALIDLHQQFDTLDIHHVNFQLRMIDALAGNDALLQTYQTQYKAYQTNQRKLNQLHQQASDSGKELDFLKFQFEELESTKLVAGEQQVLEHELQQLTSAEDVKQITGLAYAQLIENEQNVVSALREIAKRMGQVGQKVGSVHKLAQRLDSSILELEDIAKDCNRIAEGTDHDGERIAFAQERLNILYKLLKKHQLTDADALIELADQLGAKLKGYTNSGEEIEALEKAIAAQKKELTNQAAVLTSRRKAVIPKFESDVHTMLEQLSMPHARLKVDQAAAAQPGPTGMDEISFLFATNVGSKFLPIKDVASGGELARLTLCTKSLVADAIPLPTLIFDEIDTGVSGDVAQRMGLILKELSSRHQVVAITHTPQVASKAEAHYFVYKKVEENRSYSRIKQLSHDERVRAIATMLSGNPPSDAALITAAELMGGS
jgi:DNA repair protein RecN (Recombination protein N)